MSALAVSCDHPGCHARPGEPCVEGGRVLAVFHMERCIAGRQVANAAAGRQPPVHRGRWRDEKPAANGRKERA